MNVKKMFIYNPYANVLRILTNPQVNADHRLTKLWTEFIGQKVVVSNPITAQQMTAVDTLFSADPIAYRLMSQLILYQPKIEYIIAKQNEDDITAFIKNAKNPVLVIEPNSRFAAVIHKNSYSESCVSVDFWKLTSTDLPQNCKLVKEYCKKFDVSSLDRKDETFKRILNDPIYNNIISKISKIDTPIDVIVTKENFVSYAKKQSLSEMVFSITHVIENPILCLESGSKFAAIIEVAANETVYLHIFNLENTL